jgi:hypothetical protein
MYYVTCIMFLMDGTLLEIQSKRDRNNSKLLIEWQPLAPLTDTPIEQLLSHQTSSRRAKEIGADSTVDLATSASQEHASRCWEVYTNWASNLDWPGGNLMGIDPWPSSATGPSNEASSTVSQTLLWVNRLENWTSTALPLATGEVWKSMYGPKWHDQ